MYQLVSFPPWYFQDVTGLERGNLIILERPRKQPGGVTLVCRRRQQGEYGTHHCGLHSATMATYSELRKGLQKCKKKYIKKNNAEVKLITFNKPTFIGDEYSIGTVKPIGNFYCYMITGISKGVKKHSEYGRPQNLLMNSDRQPKQWLEVIQRDWTFIWPNV